jgi:hypothetical protein
MKDVGAFLNLQESKDGGATKPQYNVSFVFRTQRSLEVLGNQIINWTFQVGKTNIGSNYGDLKQGSFSWNYGDPITFMVTLANTSKYIPLPTPGNSYMRTNGYNAFVSDNSAWSLLNFVSNFSTCKNLSNCKVQQLEFNVPVMPNAFIKFYCSITFEDVQTKKIVDFPNFPTKAPEISVANP